MVGLNLEDVQIKYSGILQNRMKINYLNVLKKLMKSID
ncbi:unnamed protein product [Trichobilharzia regenti]|nr:unnamed protein product [Trichobilharzia regenti]